MPYADRAKRLAASKARYLKNRVLKGRPGIEARFWNFVEPIMDDRGCWEWSGSLNNKGYGEIRHNRTALAHRVSYELNVGPIPEGLSLDHLCRNTSCVNPQHLDPVTHKENVRRGIAGMPKSVCKRGHALKPDNIYLTARGKTCRTCALNRANARYHFDAKLIPNPLMVKRGAE